MTTTDRRWRRRLLAAALPLTLATAACGGAERDPADVGQVKDQLVVAWTGDLNSMDPPFSLVEWNRELAVNVYEPLVRYKLVPQPDGSLTWDGLEVAPALATSWDIDGASITFHLRQGVKFHPSGNPLTAEDVKYSFERTVAVPGGFGAFNANLAGIFDPVKQVTVVDPATVKLSFTNAAGEPMLLPASLPSMRFPQFSILDSKTAKSKATPEDPWSAKWLAENVAGTGPYYVAERTPNQQTVLQAVPDYWGEQPQIKKVVLRVTGSADIVALMKGGDIDLAATGLTPRSFDELASSGYSVLNQPIPNIVSVHLAVDDEALKDVRVRQAIAYAMPYDQILKVALAGRGERAMSYVNPKSPGYEPAWEQYSTNVDKAKQLLAEAGVTSLTLPMFYDSGVVYNEDIALLVKDALGQVGITVEASPQPTTQFAEQRTARVKKAETSQHGLLLGSSVIWLDDPDPSTDTPFKTGGSSNWTHYSNATVDSLHAEHRFDPDAAARAAAYQQVQETIAADVPTIPLAITGRTVALNPALTAMSFTNDSHTRFWTLGWRK
ncbi:ABC transporter substrate-binding protein [Phytohabitans kaempferiae]|uniref:ABC transporter substrate-binding protein n=1 Tax=Phytohabitans kaempferiae TaxID=1620943 RepID=A0ABV6MH93_9ACTN